MEKRNRDLLVGVLAVVADAIPRPALLSAVRGWAEDPQQSLTQMIKDAGLLDDAQIQALECLADAHLKKNQNELRRCLDAWNAHELTQDILTEIHDDALLTTLNMSLGEETTPSAPEKYRKTAAPAGTTPAPAGADRGRFQRLHPHAQGGIGQVWVARDSELQREVALKEILPRYAERADQRARFVLEAEITGNLEHPGIVPVYSLGRTAEGRPYYAMRFIRGESLSVAIGRFHDGLAAEHKNMVGRTKPIWGGEFRHLLGRFLDVCDAMDYAHSRGVLHRDLKPANIMLGRYGETLVVDWGLAKVIGKNDGFVDAGGEVERTLSDGSITSSGETVEGTTIGTPAYMSPEQARGAIDKLAPVSDVYSLGATLYELLTGRVAFAGKSVSEVIDKVQKGIFAPPRSIHRSLPAPLEAICLKAMAFTPEHRYRSVREMAQDLEHWLADEPVKSYPERPLERLGRWLRQHRAWTLSAAAALIGVSIVATGAVVVIDRARRRETTVRKEAETNFKLAQTAVEDYLTSVSENTLLKEQDSVDLRSLRQQLLESALKYYQRFVSQHQSDPSLRRQLADAYSRVGAIKQEIGSADEAIRSFRSSEAIWQSLIAANRSDDDAGWHLADSKLAIGKKQGALGDLHAALGSFNEARTILEELARRHPALATYQSSLADCYSEIGIIQGQLESDDHGLAILEQARSIEQGLLDRSSGDAAYRKKLAEIKNVMGFLHFKRSEYPKALQSFQEVQNICRSLIQEITDGPKPIKLLDLLALSEFNLATIQLLNKDFDGAVASFEQSLEHRSALVAAHPSVSSYKENLGASYREVGIAQHQAGQDSKALDTLQKSLTILEPLVAATPEQARYHAGLGRSLNALGWVYDESRDNIRAIPEFRKAIEQQELAIARSPDDNEYKLYLSNHLENLGEQYADLGRVKDGLPYYERAMGIRRQLYHEHPELTGYAVSLADALSVLGTIQRQAGMADSAFQSFAEACQVLEKLAGPQNGDGTARSRLSTALTREAETLIDQTQWERAQKLLDQAVAMVSNDSAGTKASTRTREVLTEALWERARVLRSLNHQAEADQLGRDRELLWKSQPPADLAALALSEVTRAAVIGYGKAPVANQADSPLDRDLVRAAANLRLAIALGYNDFAMVKSHPFFPLLQSRDDFKPLIKALQERSSSRP